MHRHQNDSVPTPDLKADRQTQLHVLCYKHQTCRRFQPECLASVFTSGVIERRADVVVKASEDGAEDDDRTAVLVRLHSHRAALLHLFQKFLMRSEGVPGRVNKEPIWKRKSNSRPYIHMCDILNHVEETSFNKMSGKIVLDCCHVDDARLNNSHLMKLCHLYSRRLNLCFKDKLL